MNNVTLVNGAGIPTGSGEKMDIHIKGLLHLAFSVVLVDCLKSPVKTVMQKRAGHKYHSGGLWSNACCGHPMPQENIPDAAKRRLFEELGIHHNHLTPLGTTTYRLNLINGLIEHEWNQIFIGKIHDESALLPMIQPNPEEIDHCQWMPIDELIQDIAHRPECYTPWLPFVLRAARLM
jgi:isopentenyl-diphosphate delta-isomerase